MEDHISSNDLWDIKAFYLHRGNILRGCLCNFCSFLQGPCYINFDRFPYDLTKAEEEFSGWDRDF